MDGRQLMRKAKVEDESRQHEHCKRSVIAIACYCVLEQITCLKRKEVYVLKNFIANACFSIFDRQIKQNPVFSV